MWVLLTSAGGGKTTQVKILSGDLQPTVGEVIKSSKDLRVAFLRQEFVDELVMHRSLKEELTSVFKEESEILNELQACEVRYLFIDGVVTIEPTPCVLFLESLHSSTAGLFFVPERMSFSRHATSVLLKHVIIYLHEMMTFNNPLSQSLAGRTAR